MSSSQDQDCDTNSYPDSDYMVGSDVTSNDSSSNGRHGKLNVNLEQKIGHCAWHPYLETVAIAGNKSCLYLYKTSDHNPDSMSMD